MKVLHKLGVAARVLALLAVLLVGAAAYEPAFAQANSVAGQREGAGFISGRWNVTGAYDDITDPVDFWVSFSHDGTFVDRDNYQGTWLIAGSSFSMTYTSVEMGYVGQIQNGAISGRFGGGSISGEFRMARSGDLAGGPTQGWTVERVLAEAGQWQERVGLPRDAPAEFSGYFMVTSMTGVGTAGPGAIVQGREWDASINPYFTLIYGRHNVADRFTVADFPRLTFLGTDWDPAWIAISDALLAGASGETLTGYPYSCGTTGECRQQGGRGK